MAKDDVARLQPGAVFDFVRQDLADAAQTHVAKLVFAHIRDHRRVAIFGELRAFRHHDDAEVTAARMAHANTLGNFLDVEGTLGNKNDVGPAGDAAVHCDPTRVAAHHLDHHHALMRFGGGVYAINGFGRGVHRGVETKTEVGPHQIVVDGLGNADHFQAQFVHTLGHAHGVVSADGDQGFHTVGPQDFHAALQSAFALGRIGPRSAQDGASPRQNARDRIHVHLHGLVLVNPAPPFHEADKLIVIVHDAFAHHRSYDGVQSRAVATAGQNPDSHVRQYPSTEIVKPSRHSCIGEYTVAGGRGHLGRSVELRTAVPAEVAFRCQPCFVVPPVY